VLLLLCIVSRSRIYELGVLSRAFFFPLVSINPSHFHRPAFRHVIPSVQTVKTYVRNKLLPVNDSGSFKWPVPPQPFRPILNSPIRDRSLLPSGGAVLAIE